MSQVGSRSSFYSDTKTSENVLNGKNVKGKKRTHAFKGYTSSYKVEILNSFNRKPPLKDTASAIKIKLKKLLSELRRFKFLQH